MKTTIARITRFAKYKVSRVFSAPEKDRLASLLANSRKFQNVVSTQLAGQVLEALYELLRGFQAADDQVHGRLLRDVLKGDPNQVYTGLLTTLMRIVFLLYAEDRGLLSTDSVYVNYYSVNGLYQRLRADEGRYPDTMDQRYGAWAQLISTFRLIFEGGSHAGLRIPARHGYVFDPARYPFLEGRGAGEEVNIPRIADGFIYRILSKLVILDGERLSYRNLDVEQIGSVYEAIMGFELHTAQGPSIAIRPSKRAGAPTTINLEELLKVEPAKRQKWLADNTDQKLTGQGAEAIKSASTVDELVAALERKIAYNVTPEVVQRGAMVFQPSDERRRSGSHYTPRSLTKPIVEGTLEPVLRRLGTEVSPEQILELKVCDPAMGSGTFLVEACRQLGQALVTAWHKHGSTPVLPPDEDESLYAQRLVAQRCIYGVDKNPMATDLAKLSLWLATLASEHPFTFLDHNLRTGDSLVGLDRKQIAAFHWVPTGEHPFPVQILQNRIQTAAEFRQRILAAAEDVPYDCLQQQLASADDALSLPRDAGDAAIGVFFANGNATARERARIQARLRVEKILRSANTEELPPGPPGIKPFHWALEFPEVFSDELGGFDAIVGNPPFAGKNTLIAAHPEGYLDWLKTIHPETHGNSDLVAHFFRRAFTLLRGGGCFGLIATNTIGQGDTRSTGLRWICTHGGTLYRARKRLKWPGQAAVVVSVVHVTKGAMPGPYLLDNRAVEAITAYLFHAGGHEDPAQLKQNAGKSFQGSIVLGMGFTFDDSDTKGVATPLAEMERLIAKDPRNKERIFPYIGGEEINDSPTHAHHRYVINFEDFPLRRKNLSARWQDAEEHQRKEWLRDGIVPLDYPDPVAADWPDLLSIVERKVKPERDRDNQEARRRNWWKFGARASGLYSETAKLNRVLAISRVTTYQCFATLPARHVFSESLVLITDTRNTLFACLQSRVHEIWTRFFASSLEDRLRYTPTDCFETFPFPLNFRSNSTLEKAGCTYYDFRAQLIQRQSKGLTAIYNWFHDPSCECPEIPKLRELHDAMDRAILDTYGWTDIQPQCEFIPEFDDEVDEDDGGHPRRKKYRYRWPDEIRDEVLARLLALNRQRALEEGQATDELEGLETHRQHGLRPA